MSLLGMYETWELCWIAQEEYRRVVEHPILVSFLGVELYCEPSRITGGVSGTLFAADSGEAG